jgi:hypothetical protein
MIGFSVTRLSDKPAGVKGYSYICLGRSMALFRLTYRFKPFF